MKVSSIVCRLRTVAGKVDRTLLLDNSREFTFDLVRLMFITPKKKSTDNYTGKERRTKVNNNKANSDVTKNEKRNDIVLKKHERKFVKFGTTGSIEDRS